MMTSRKPRVALVAMVALTALASVATLAVSSVASAEPTFNRHPRLHSPAVKPAGVPADYVLTHNGFFHPSCVVQLQSNEVWGQDLVIRGLDGRVHDTIAPCEYPRFSLKGRALPAESARSARMPKASDATIVNTSSGLGSIDGVSSATPDRMVRHPSNGGYDGWVVYYDYSGSIPNGASLTTEWVVPLPPKTVGDQDIAFFNDFETTNIILQPVLDFSEIPGQWAIESENCCAAGNDVQSTLVQVAAGDVIKGVVTMADCSSGNVCTNWTVTTTDLNTGKSTVLNMQNPKEAADELNPGVLETYSVTTCDMLPENGEVTFYNNTLTDSSGTTQSKTYSLNTIITDKDAPAGFPTDCNYSGSVSGDSYTLIFQTSPTAIEPDGGIPTGDSDSGIEVTDAGSGGSTKDASISGSGNGPGNGTGDDESGDDAGTGGAGDNGTTTTTTSGCSFARGDAETGGGAIAFGMGLVVLGSAARRRRNRKTN